MISAADLTAAGVLPVLVLEDAGPARAVAQALRSGGLGAIEVTLRTDAALAAIRAMSGVPDIVVGAGTVLRPEQVDEAADAGASFVVSPGLSPSVVQRAQDRDVLAVPGVLTPSEIMAALDLGVNLLKFFPAESSGGVAALRALAGPFPDVQFIPTGGITEDSARDYLRLPNVPAVGGSWIATKDLIAAGEMSEIERRARAARTAQAGG